MTIIMMMEFELPGIIEVTVPLGICALPFHRLPFQPFALRTNGFINISTR